mgnify:FL=1
MAFTAADVKKLREMTGCGMMDCKKALTESDGDMEKAAVYLREKGLAAVEKKAGRIAAEGLVLAVVRGEKGAIVEVNSETDFVAKNQSFRDFVELVANTVIDNAPADVDALLACRAESGTIADELREKVLTIGENIKIRRFQYFEGVLVGYVHAGGTHAVIVKFDADAAVAAKPEFEAYGKDVAMQIAALNPRFRDKSDVTQDVLDEERTILVAQMDNDPKMAAKPQQVKEKIAAGKLNKFYEENCLLQQSFVKNGDLTVEQYTEQTAKQLGGDIKVVGYCRYEKGEGLEKRQDDFAAEVASMQK